ncbi:MAG: DUF6512 family protein [Chitinophagaceae bacterium]
MTLLNKWRIAGILTLTLSGFLFHYVYSWSGNSRIIGLIAPVNESVWEHLKLGFWAVVLFSAAEYSQLKNKVSNYFFARMAGILSLELTILSIFYSYTMISGHSILWIDILSYVLGVIAGQYITHFLFRRNPLPAFLNRLGLATIIVLGIVFAVLTCYPPHSGLFKDPNNHSYGIMKKISKK